MMKNTGLEINTKIRKSEISAPGDSGSPVFIDGSTVKLVEVHKGRWGDYAAFSPMSGVRQDLGITPLIT